MLRTTFPFFVIFFSLVWGCTEKPSSTPTSPTLTSSSTQAVNTPQNVEKKPLPPCPQDDENCRTQRIEKETLGWLATDLSAENVTKKLGKPDTKGEIWEEGATGDFVQEWEYPKEGIFITMRATTQTGSQSIGNLRITAPSSLKTLRGIGIGSTEKETKTIYADALSPESTEGFLIAGSIYWGVFFSIEQGNVSEIFIGAGAE